MTKPIRHKDSGFILVPAVAIALILLVLGGALAVISNKYTKVKQPNALLQTPGISRIFVDNSEKTYVELGAVTIPSKISKTVYFQGDTKKYELAHGDYTSTYAHIPEVDAEILGETSKAIYFMSQNELKKYNKSTNDVIIVKTPSQGNEELYGSPINSELAFITLYPDSGQYLLNLNTESFTKIDAYSKSCGYYCFGGSFQSSIDKDTILVEQGGGDACWGRSILTLFNLKTLKVTPVGEFDTGCVGEKDSYIGAIGRNIYTSADMTVENRGTIYKSLNKIDVLTGKKTILLDYATMPKDIVTVQMGNNNNIILTAENRDFFYEYSLTDNKLRPLENTNFETQRTEADKALKVDTIETKIKNIKEAAISRSEDNLNNGGSAIVITDENNTKVELVSGYALRQMYNKLAGVKKEDANCYYAINYSFSNVTFNDNKIEFSVESTPPKNEFAICSKYYPKGNHFQIMINLTTNKVFIKQ